MKATLALENGLWFEGDAAGAAGETGGEVVFNTSMTGYQEVLTDPSYAGQIVTMTAPEMGNYGVAAEDVESRGAAGRRLRDPRRVAGRQQLARGRHAARLPGAPQHRRDFRHRHARADARAAIGRRHARHHRDRRRRSARARGPRAGAAARWKGPIWCSASRASARSTGRRSPIRTSSRRRHAAAARRAGRLRVAAYDFGMKWNILRRFTAYGCECGCFRRRRRPPTCSRGNPDGVFLSNGPGDPAVLSLRHRERARDLVDADVPVFGICLGHQILALAMGGETFKLKFGHRGANHPVKELETGQGRNHVAEPRLRRRTRIAAGRRRSDARESLRRHRRRAAPREPAGLLRAVPSRGLARAARCRLPVRQFLDEMERAQRSPMPKRTDLKRDSRHRLGPDRHRPGLRVRLFRHAGVQGAAAEGLEVVLVNSNPATIMTDPEIADRTYVEPLTVEVLDAVIERERPDAILPTVGGQTALNLAVQLAEHGILAKHNVELIGASIDAIKVAEDRLLFRDAMREIGIAVPDSRYVKSMEEALRGGRADRLSDHHPPVVHARRRRRRHRLQHRGVPRDRAARPRASAPCTRSCVEESVIGWKEFELEVMRDRADNFVVICSIENIDPMGVHTGDSITVAPALTLTDKEYQRMRDIGRRIIRRVGVETGGSNIQFAINPDDGRIVAIEMNPRVSRSSALASKATGFPDRQDRGQARARLHARRDSQRHHAADAGVVRADHRLRRRQGAALGVREIPAAPTAR